MRVNTLFAAFLGKTIRYLVISGINLLGFISPTALVKVSEAYEYLVNKENAISFEKPPPLQNIRYKYKKFVYDEELKRQDEAERATLFNLGTVELDPVEPGTNVWELAWERNLREQGLINNIVKELLNAFTRIVGWTTLELLLYGGSGLVPSSLSTGKSSHRRKTEL